MRGMPERALACGTLEAMADYDFYAAGPFFNEAQVASMERMEQVLESHGRALFKPRFASDVSEVGPEACFRDDIDGIRASRAVIANLIDEDSGTMYEIGYAYAHGIPVFGYLEGLEPGGRVNLMIAQSLTALFTSPEALGRYLETGAYDTMQVTQF